MGDMTLAEAFAKFGGRPANRLHSQSAIAPDGALILKCSAGQYAHPERGVLRYEDRLSREAEHATESQALRDHLTLAHDGNLPVRMIVITENSEAAATSRTRAVHVRTDLVGKVVKFDGDHFVVDFVRARAGQP